MNKPYILKETVRGIQQLNIEDELLQSREIFITDEINNETANELLKQLIYLEREDNTKEITLYINSPGGEVTSGFAVYDYMKLMRSPIKTVCIGTAASMASILFLAGSKREMFEHTKIMIHDPSCSANISGMKPLEVKKILDKLMQTREITAKIIADRTGKYLDEVLEKTKEDSFFTAEEALKFGLATRIIDNLYPCEATDFFGIGEDGPFDV